MVRKQVKKLDSGQEDISITNIELEEINYDLDSDPELENNQELIKYEFNMIELPFFTKDKKVEKGKARKYNFSNKDKSYMMISPSGKPGLISQKIPQEFDEKIFYGILKLSREQGSPEVITDYFTLAKVSGVHYNDLTRIKDSLERLSNCSVELHNLVYDANLKTKVAGKKPFPILQHVFTNTFEETVKLPADKKERYQKYFRNSKISEILIIEFGSFMYRNLEKKGFLYFDQKKLLGISNATARKIYVMITKWKGWEKKNSIRRSYRFLASRIPLSWEKNSIRKTVMSIDNSCKILKDSGLIENYVLEKKKPVSDSSVIFVFSSDHNKIDSYNTKASRTATGHEEITINNVEDEYLDDRQTTVFDITDNKKDPIEEEEEKQKERSKEIREKAYQKYEELKGGNLAQYEKKAQRSTYYKVMLEDKINNGSISKEEAVKEAVVMFIIGEMSE